MADDTKSTADAKKNFNVFITMIQRQVAAMLNRQQQQQDTMRQAMLNINNIFKQWGAQGR